MPLDLNDIKAAIQLQIDVYNQKADKYDDECLETEDFEARLLYDHCKSVCQGLQLAIQIIEEKERCP